MNRNRRAKILATLGPATNDRGKIAALFDRGADVFRLNFSHGSHEDHAARIADIRAIEAERGRPIAIVGDLQGPKLRVGIFERGETELEAGQRFRLDRDDRPGDGARVQLPHPELFAALAKGAELLLDDGRIRLRVLQASAEFIDTEVEVGGRLSDRKGVNVPGVVLPIAALTDKDRRDLSFALEQGVDWIALSFVQRPEDIAEARKLVAGRAAVMAKLEKPAAIDRLDEIIELSDALMVARGDLGVELPPEDVPIIQKRIVRACRKAGKPVVVATQMLESMVREARPTRAEASDVAAAVYEGADAVMLSAETAVGRYPAESVAIMDRIIARVERDPLFETVMDAEHPEPQATSADAIMAAARQVAHTIGAAAIVTYTTSGSTSVRASRERPAVPILSLTPNLATARRLCLVWGVHSVHTTDVHDVEEMVLHSCGIAAQQGMAKSGQRVVITAGMPFGTPGRTNLLRIAWVDGA